jgi:hypothetical protein
MCDYSLLEYNARLAMDGERLEVYRLTSGVKGLVALPRVARLRLCNVQNSRRRPAFSGMPSVVCVSPGTRLFLYDIPLAMQIRLGVSGSEEVTFTELQSVENFRDAVQFHQGSIVALQDLNIGQRMEVLDFSPAKETSAAPPVAAHRHAA